MIAASLLLLGTVAAPPLAPAAAGESARYRLRGTAVWRDVSAVENAGYRVVLSSKDGATLEARVDDDARPLRDTAGFPVEPGSLPSEAQAVLAKARTDDPSADALARVVTRGARTVLEAVERVVSFTSRVLKYEPPTGELETAASCRRRGRGSCVGRSLVAEDLLLRSGVPARQVTGVLAAAAAEELTSETRALFNEALGGVRHRWIEAYVPGLGWVPSDPGGLANAVTSRYLALRGAPGPDFGVETIARSVEVRWPALAMPGPGLTLARARGGATP